MNRANLLTIIKDLGIIIFIAIIFFVIKLSQNQVKNPLELSNIFSTQNIIETTIQLLLIAAIVIPIRLVYIKATKRNNE